MNPLLGYENGKLLLTVSPRYKDDAIQVAGMRHIHMDTYSAPATWAAAKQARGVFGTALELTPEAVEWATNEKTKVDQIAHLKTLSEPPEEWTDYLHTVLDDVEGFTLTPMQKLDALIMALEGSCLNASVTGYGKTVVTLAAIKLLWAWGKNPFPVLVVCRPLMRSVWEWEAKRQFSHLGFTFQTIWGTPAKRKQRIAAGTHFAFVSYKGASLHSRMAKLYSSQSLTEKQKTPQELNGRYRTVVGDELHRIASRKAVQSQCLWALSEEAEYRFGLTWTPQRNDVSDIWSQMRFISPLEWENWKKTKERYFLEEFSWYELQNRASNAKKHRLNLATEEEWHAILEPHWLRRTEKMNKIERIYQPPRFVEMSSKQTTAYKQMAKDMMAELDGEILVAANPAVKTLRLRQIANGTPVFGTVKATLSDGEEVDRSTIRTLVMPSCKVDALLEELEDSEDQVVVFAESRLLLNLCKAVLDSNQITNCLIAGVSGPAKERERDRNVIEFNLGKFRVCLVQYQTGSESITLTAARRAIFLEGTFDYVASVQAPGRIDRHTQLADAVEYVTIVAKETIEEGLWRDVFGKGEDATKNLRDKQWWVQNIMGSE